jgi:uncharacterized membrane protein YtjA (UPF0391 family)
MLMWAITFLIIAVVAALFGFREVAGVATQAAKILFFVFIVLFLCSIVYQIFFYSPGIVSSP